MEEELKTETDESIFGNMSVKTKALLMVGIGAIAMGAGIYFLRNPRFHIRRYSRIPRVQKPRKYRRILRRKNNKLKNK